GARTLAAHWQAATMPQTTVALNVFQTRDVLLCLAAQRPFDRVFTIQDGGQASDIFIAQLLGAALWIDAGLLTQTQSSRRTNAIDIAQRNVRRFVVGQVNTQDTRHGASPRSALALFVTGIAANDQQ